MIEFTYRSIVIQQSGCRFHVPRLGCDFPTERDAEKAIDAALDPRPLHRSLGRARRDLMRARLAAGAA